jgi:outer membrane receptor for ferrienterochelin and colicins
VHAWDVERRRVLPGQPRHVGTAGLDLFRRRWGTGLRARGAIFGARTFWVETDDAPATARRTPVYGSLDVRAFQRMFSDHLEVFAGVDNVLDAGDASDLPIPPRTYYAGITARY